MIELGVYRERLAESGLRVFARAVEESRHNQQNYVSFFHLLKALAVEDAESLADILRDLKVEQPLTNELMEKAVIGSPDWRGGGIRISGQVISLLWQAKRIARADEREKVEAADLFSALAQGVRAGRSLVFLRVSPPHSLVVQG